MRLFRMFFVLPCIILASCEQSPQKSATTKQESAPALPAGLFASQEPADAKSVIDAKKDAAVGDTVAVRGRIGGSASPFVEGRAMFTIADVSLPPCNANPDDKCSTPWDYCCEPSDKIAAQTITVQVAERESRPLKLELNGVESLKPLAEVVIKGRVSKKSDPAVMVIDATEIFVKK